MASFVLLKVCFLSTFAINFSLITAQPAAYVNHLCSGGEYTANSTYDTNLNLLLSSLSSNGNENSINRNGFYNSTAGRNTDTIYGALQCRGDVTPQSCRSCVDTATQNIRKKDMCPVSKEAIIWYDLCMLRYSNESFLSIMQENPSIYLWSLLNVPEPTRFNQTLSDLLDDIISEAVSSSVNNTNLFATGVRNFTTLPVGVRNFTTLQQIYGLVQCTSDIDPTSCSRCLRGAVTEIPRCCDGKQGARVIKPSCNLRFEPFQFYQSKVSTTGVVPLSPSPSTNTTSAEGKGKNSTTVVIFITIPTAVIAVLSAMAIWLFCIRRRKIPKKFDNVDEIQSAESLQFHLITVRTATGNFSDANKLGQGGFGSVYKGVLPGGEEIAVKRLSRSSGQGEEEFKNEVILLAKLQHKNLVRLHGFCLDGEEKLLIYEFLPNGSLDQLLFDPVKCISLGWERRHEIVRGIARGLLYLHEDSRHRIIHRDLKASNILLSSDMNPKISDFGMARLFLVDQTQGNTSRIVGTYGYMPPEYALHGQFSVKSDVFSYGVLVLEIICGQKNTSFYDSERDEYLLSYAWRCWKEGKSLELLNPSLREYCSRSEVIRCVHIGLLCVQEDVADRPTMATIVLMLNSYSVTLPLPSPPAFFVESRRDPNLLPNNNETAALCRTNQRHEHDASITDMYPR